MSVAIVTGANGFVGRHLCDELVRHGWQVRVITRGPAPVETRRYGTRARHRARLRGLLAGGGRDHPVLIR